MNDATNRKQKKLPRFKESSSNGTSAQAIRLAMLLKGWVNESNVFILSSGGFSEEELGPAKQISFSSADVRYDMWVFGGARRRTRLKASSYRPGNI